MITYFSENNRNNKRIQSDSSEELNELKNDCNWALFGRRPEAITNCCLPFQGKEEGCGEIKDLINAGAKKQGYLFRGWIDLRMVGEVLWIVIRLDIIVVPGDCPVKQAK